MNDRSAQHRRRAAALLRLGSAGGDEGPSPGFEARLRARIAAGARRPNPLPWVETLGLVARPALAVAALVIVATAAVHLWDRSPSSELASAVSGELDGLFDESLP